VARFEQQLMLAAVDGEQYQYALSAAHASCPVSPWPAASPPVVPFPSPARSAQVTY
jgi:hypothetical protein